MAKDYNVEIAALKRKLSTGSNEVGAMLTQGRAALKEPSVHANYFIGMTTVLEKYYSMFEDAYEGLSAIKDSSDRPTSFEFPTEEYVKLQSNTRKAYYEIKRILVSVNPSTSTSSAASHDLNTAMLNTTSTVIQTSQRLPEIKLIKFDGELLNWPKFRDTFVSIVHEDEHLSPTKKFHYLITSLSGPALSLVSKFPIQDENYKLAWDALKETYEKKRLLASAYLNRILNSTPIQGKPNVDTLKTFITTVCDSVSAFRLLSIQDEASFILFHLSYRLLDQSTRDQFQNSHKDTEFPTFDQLFKFIKDRCFTLQLSSDTNATFESNQTSTPKSNERKHISKKSTRSSLVVQKSKDSNNSSYPICSVCKEGSHALLSCKKFYAGTVDQRIAWLSNWKGCKNCFSTKHQTNSCSSKWVCRWCKNRHHSMICRESQSRSNNNTNIQVPPQDPSGSSAAALTTVHDEASHVLLGTVLAEVQDSRGTYHTIRLVVDTASHYSFMTYRCAHKLGLSTNKCSLNISGIGQSLEGSKGYVNCVIRPRCKTTPLLNMKALLLRTITSHLPTVSLPHRFWVKYTNFPLADPTFFESKPIDVLLGADMFADIWLGAPVEIDQNSPKLFPSIFGHVVIGKFSPGTKETSSGTSLIVNNVSDADINTTLRRFWEIEEPKSIDPVNVEDECCENHFVSTHYRLDNGSYGVRLAFKTNPPQFSDISSISMRRFRNQENRLMKNSDLQEQYHSFMREYIDLGHMSINSSPPLYIIPHHHVTKLDRNKIKLRVVFDASANSINGSLNDYLYVGPKLQTDIRDVLLNFRTHKVALVADIVKMYRNIWIHPEDRKYQTIYWRFNPFEELRNYQLNTVVYGLTSSPFLALRVIKQLIIDEGSPFQQASEVLSRDIYIDDICSGSESIDEALELKQQLITLLGKGQFKLSKWASNYPELLKNVPESETVNQPVPMTSKDDATLKILGLQWNPESDSFTYNLEVPSKVHTKRAILSNVAKIYDPLGFLAPVVVLMKSFMQELWKLGIDWDEPIPQNLGSRWESVVEQLPILSNLSITRFVCIDKPYRFQIVGFSDASEKAYCAALYLRIIKNGEIKANLLTAKTKLAPLKTLTIPRLELCGCLLLVRLYQSISGFLDLLDTSGQIAAYFFTDSTIALGWLNTPSYKLKTFVCNRVVEILQSTSVSQWYHVSSNNNPADCGSRGIYPEEMMCHSLWWSGPPWLLEPHNTWQPFEVSVPPTLPEIKPTPVLISIESTPSFNAQFVVELISKFSSYHRLLRTICRIFRFFNKKSLTSDQFFGPVKLQELDDALHLCVKAVQSHYFFKNDLSKNQNEILKRFVKLNPFFDSSGILRAGGRLYHSDLPYNHKHPILLPPESHLSELIVDSYHRAYLHPGPSLLQALVQSKFWIPSLRRLVQKRIFMCGRCYRLKAKPSIPKMADLPSYRVQAIRAFMKTGVDFAGPFVMKESHRRKSPTSKVYFCVFVCMATKAIHLEAVTRLTSDAFLAAFDRFVSLRGLPSDVFSDCGSNFVSAARTLKELNVWFTNIQTQNEIANQMTFRQTKWHFNPPHSPHFGGIWEAGVKSAKVLMLRTVGDTALTYEELATLLYKIGAVLNSRPLCPLSTDPSECDYLSPGHFLIGEPMLSVPEPSLLDTPLNRLDRWQLLQRMAQFFWTKWRRDYLCTLQSRGKWNERTPNLQIGDLVLIKDPNVPILQWPRGRVTAIHPGRDGAVRVATIKTAKSSFTRPVVNLIPLLPDPQS
uniref:Pro-Pol polyprotein n=1 Tax=Lygus hesperus TaxID=30085 RepID=A0A0A9VSF7_LYGHE